MNINKYGTGEPILFIHGALVSQAMWQPQIAIFRNKYQVITLDLPAHGNVPDLSGEYTIERLAEYILEQLEIMKIKRANICGHSLGGMVAQQLAIKYPEYVDKLILAETAFGTRNNLWEKVLTAITIPFLQITPHNYLIDISAKQYGLRNENTGEFVRNEMSRYDHRITMRVMSAALKYSGKSNLNRIISPTLILIAEDNKQTHAQGKEMAKIIKNSKIAIIKKANHLLNIDNQMEFNTTVIEFLGSNHNK
jgi:3-oxoadipate enol-lactonase